MYMNDTEYRKFKNSRFYGYFDLLKEEIARLGQMGVQFLFFQTPLRQNIKNLSEFEQQRLDHWEFDFNHITDRDCEMIKQIYPPEVTTDYLQQVYDGQPGYSLKDARKSLSQISFIFHPFFSHKSPLLSIYLTKQYQQHYSFPIHPFLLLIFYKYFHFFSFLPPAILLFPS